MTDNIQSNIKQGRIVALCLVDLTGLEGRIVKPVNDSGVLKFDLPAALADFANYVVIEGAAAGSYGTFEPLVPGQRVRVKANSTSFVPGDKVVAYASGQEGKATEYAGSGSAFVVGISEEVGDTAGQNLLINPVLSWIS